MPQGKENNNSKTDTSSAIAKLIERMRQAGDESLGMDKIPGQVDSNADVAAIVLAGGQGTRLQSAGNVVGKQLIKMAGKPVLTWSMDTFDSVGQIGQIVVVVPENEFEEYIEKVVSPFAFQTPVVMAKAGDSRQESAFNGLDMVASRFKYVVVHDGARPLLPISTVEHVISELKADPDLDGAICATPAIDTLKVVERGRVIGTPDRKVFWMAQTPQAFVTSRYKMAHRNALADGFVGTDDSSLLERIGGNIKIVEGKRNNIKLTVPEDQLILASVLNSLQMQHGSEYDI